MTDISQTSRPPNPSLYVTDAEIIRRWGMSLKRGYRVLKQLDRPNPGRRRFPQPDPLFCNRRYWPAVLQWHNDYHRVRTEAEAPSVQPMWQENFDEPATGKARKSERARPELAKT